MPGLEGKAVLVTGGSSGIGLAAARFFVEAGANVLITGRHVDALDHATHGQSGMHGFVADAADPAAAKGSVAEALRLWGRLDVLVNNAGAGCPLTLAAATLEAVEQMCAVNIAGPTFLAQSALSHLRKTNGAIVNVSSVIASRPAPGLSHYGATKAALEHMTRAWALELAPDGIRVNAVAAGPTETNALTGMMGLSAEEAKAVEAHEREQVPLGRRGKPEDIARWIVALARPDAEWVTGQVITIDGGWGLRV